MLGAFTAGHAAAQAQWPGDPLPFGQLGFTVAGDAAVGGVA